MSRRNIIISIVFTGLLIILVNFDLLTMQSVRNDIDEIASKYGGSRFNGYEGAWFFPTLEKLNLFVNEVRGVTGYANPSYVTYWGEQNGYVVAISDLPSSSIPPPYVPNVPNETPTNQRELITLSIIGGAIIVLMVGSRKKT